MYLAMQEASSASMTRFVRQACMLWQSLLACQCSLQYVFWRYVDCAIYACQEAHDTKMDKVQAIFTI